MGKITVSAEGAVAAPAPTVYGYLADMREHHPKFLPLKRLDEYARAQAG